MFKDGIPAYEVGHVLQGELKDTEIFVSTDSDRILQRHDLITGRVGGLGAFSEYKSDLPASFSDNILRLRPKEHEKPRAAFVAEYLNCSVGNTQLLRGSRGSLQKVITQRSLGEIVVPLLGQREEELVAAMDAARAERKAKLAESDALLAGVDDYVLDVLGINLPSVDPRQVFAVGSHSVRKRVDPYFHSPKFARIQDALAAIHCESLGSFTVLSKETWRPENHEEPTFQYIEISTVNPKTGEVYSNSVPVDEAPSRARMKVRANDIIVSLTRPHHGSIALLGAEFEGCIASTGFAVIRDVAAHVRRDYLWHILRTQFCLNQMLQRASGGSYPAITEAELANITIPVPRLEVQADISSEIRQRHQKSRLLRAEAESGWQAAKQWFEEQLLGRPIEQ